MEIPNSSELTRILIINSESEADKKIYDHLIGAGYDVDVTTGGEEGLEQIESFQPACLLCELATDTVDGISFLKQIADKFADLPIIVLSSEALMSDVVEALRLGASDFLIKPIVDLEVLEHAIERSLERYELRLQNLQYRAQLELANSELKNNLAMLEQDQQAGLLVQMKMLPDNPMQKGAYVFRHQMVPSLYLSGDFVEHVTVGTDYVVFFVADVSGHGASSAFVTVLLKNLTARMRSDFGRLGDETVLHPAEFLVKANAELLDTGIGKHVTLFYAVLNTRLNTMTYSVAGQLPLPIMVANGSASYVEGQGAPIGLFEEPSYVENNIELPGEFRLALFSDGVLEVLDRTTLAEKEAYLLEKAPDFRSDTESVLRTLGIDSDQQYPDDIAVLIVDKH